METLFIYGLMTVFVAAFILSIFIPSLRNAIKPKYGEVVVRHCVINGARLPVHFCIGESHYNEYFFINAVEGQLDAPIRINAGNVRDAWKIFSDVGTEDDTDFSGVLQYYADKGWVCLTFVSPSQYLREIKYLIDKKSP